MHTVRRVLPHEYNKYQQHLQALDTESRNLRFAHPVTDEVINTLCSTWAANPDKHILFAVEDDQLNFIGIGHIALEGGMELAFSVHKEYRGQGIGDKLMERCISYCRTHNLLEGYMVCLSHNAAIKHMCLKHGIHIHTEYGETTADIHLDAPNLSTFVTEATDSNLAVLDYLSKRTLLPWTLVHKKFDSLS